MTGSSEALDFGWHLAAEKKAEEEGTNVKDGIFSALLNRRTRLPLF